MENPIVPELLIEVLFLAVDGSDVRGRGAGHVEVVHGHGGGSGGLGGRGVRDLEDVDAGYGSGPGAAEEFRDVAVEPGEVGGVGVEEEGGYCCLLSREGEEVSFWESLVNRRGNLSHPKPHRPFRTFHGSSCSAR